MVIKVNNTFFFVNVQKQFFDEAATRKDEEMVFENKIKKLVLY